MSDTGVGLRSSRGPVLLAVMVATGLVAMEATVIATAVPTIVADIGGLHQFAWLFSVYLLAQAVSVPIYAKLADTIGRKPILIFGIALFTIGSVLCAAAWSMPALIAFRAVQGLGAGAIQPMGPTIIADIYTVAERARVQGYIASVWAASSVLGPTVGGLLSQYVGWRWIFLINIPLGAAAIWLIARQFHEQITPRSRRIDVPGAVLLSVALTLLLLGILEGGTAWPWASWQTAATFGGAAVLFVVFGWWERRAEEPIVDVTLFRSRQMVTAIVITAAVGALLIGIAAWLPSYLQGTLRVAPVVAGLALAAITLGWPISASLSGRFYLRIGFRRTVIVGSIIVAVGTVSLALIAPTPTLWVTVIALFVIGIGMGLTATPTLIGAQAAVGWSQRGAVTGAIMLSRSFGAAVGAAAFGAVANAILLADPVGETSPSALTAAGTAVFTGAAVVAAALILIAVLMPRDSPVGATAQRGTDPVD